MAQQVKWEINELNSPTALQRFGAPFRSEHGEVSPQESELPILRYIFVHHVRDFPFLDKAKEKEFWQDKLQIVRATPHPTPPTDCTSYVTQIADLVSNAVPRIFCRQADIIL